MRLMLNAAFAFTLAAFALGLVKPVPAAQLRDLRLEFAAFHPAAPFLRNVWR